MLFQVSFALFHLLNRLVYKFHRSFAVTAFVRHSFLELSFGLFQVSKSSAHVRLVLRHSCVLSVNSRIETKPSEYDQDADDCREFASHTILLVVPKMAF